MPNASTTMLLYQRYAKQSPTGVATSSAIREFVVGSGVKGHYGLRSVKSANFEFGNATDFGVLEIELGTIPTRGVS